MAPVLRWGFLSTARINRALITPLRHSNRNTLLAVASRDPERARAYAAKWGIQKAFGSYEALLADPDIDVIYISLPNSLHAEWTVKALRAGKHVLCEKPLAITLEQVDEVTRTVRETGKVAAEAFMYRHHPMTLKAEQLLHDGAIGRPVLMRGSFNFSLNRPSDVRLDPGLGGGSIWDVGCYPISYARTLARTEPEEVFGWQVTSHRGVDLSFSGEMRFPGGLLAQVQSSFESPPFRHFEVFGEKGRMVIPTAYNPGPEESIALLSDGHEELIQIKGGDLYQWEVEDMAGAILEGKPNRVSLADSRHNIAAILAFLRSAREGQPVRL